METSTSSSCPPLVPTPILISLCIFLYLHHLYTLYPPAFQFDGKMMALAPYMHIKYSRFQGIWMGIVY